MGCNCRHGGSRRAAPSRRRPVQPSHVALDSLCSTIEKMGNELPLLLDSNLRSLRLLIPVASSLPISNLLSGSGCRGPFSSALLAAELKLAALSTSATKVSLFRKSIPTNNVQLGYLRDVLRSL